MDWGGIFRRLACLKAASVQQGVMTLADTARQMITS
jgi:hypothetical protein